MSKMLHILNDGCSFSAYHDHMLAKGDGYNLGEKENWVKGSMMHGWESYCTFLPEKVYNIALGGGGIGGGRVKRFVAGSFQYEGSDFNLTHFVLQVQTIGRVAVSKKLLGTDSFDLSPVDRALSWQSWSTYVRTLKWSENIHLRKKGKEDEMVGTKEINTLVDSYKGNKYRPRDVALGILKIERERLPLTFELYSEHADEIYNRSILSLNEDVMFLREVFPDIKIIFLKYMFSGVNVKLVEEFDKDFFNEKLPLYCDENDIAYINKENFNTNWFHKNGLTADAIHPNTEGAKVLASEIKGYL